MLYTIANVIYIAFMIYIITYCIIFDIYIYIIVYIVSLGIIMNYNSRNSARFEKEIGILSKLKKKNPNYSEKKKI